jgi:hypothetical protein
MGAADDQRTCLWRFGAPLVLLLTHVEHHTIVRVLCVLNSRGNQVVNR